MDPAIECGSSWRRSVEGGKQARDGLLFGNRGCERVPARVDLSMPRATLKRVGKRTSLFLVVSCQRSNETAQCRNTGRQSSGLFATPGAIPTILAKISNRGSPRV